MPQKESFLSSINGLPGVRARWCERIADVDVVCDRDEAMTRLRPHHEKWVHRQSGEGDIVFWRAEQVHGNRVAVVPGAETVLAVDGLPVVEGVDGLLTATPRVVLGIYVADCGPIWIADPVRRVVGLLHSGKKGTEQDILGVAVKAMSQNFSSDPKDLVVVLGPCIRPPDYEMDFASMIGDQAQAHGIQKYHDCGINTAADLSLFYSYRREMGKTGRMLATIQLEP